MKSFRLITLLTLIGTLYMSLTTTTFALDDTVKDAADAVEENVETLWERIDEARLTNRTPIQIIAWVIMGIVAATLAGFATSFRSNGWRLALGLAGAFIGGIMLSVLDFKMKMNPIIIRVEELIFSLFGAALLIIIWRLVLRKKGSKD